MTITAPPEREVSERVLVLAPVGRDARLVTEVLDGSGVHAEPTASVEALVAQLDRLLPDQVGALIIAEEALQPSQATELMAALSRQPPWSDLPLILVGNHRSPNPKRLAFLEQLGTCGSVMMLERPFHARTLVAAVQVALRSRRRQYEVRDHLQSHQRSATELANRALELQRSNTELEQFAAVASHDLQEPLRMITNYLQLLQRQYPQAFDAKSIAYMRHVTDGADRMRTMILAILEYSRVGEGGVALAPVNAMLALRDAPWRARSAPGRHSCTAMRCRRSPPTACCSARSSRT
jgi:signal transduction histidine kinase